MCYVRSGTSRAKTSQSHAHSKFPTRTLLLLYRSPPRGIDQPEYLLPIISMMFRIVSSTDDPMLWNQSFGFEEALISCSEEVLMRPGESKLENRTVKQADGAFTR